MMTKIKFSALVLVLVFLSICALHLAAVDIKIDDSTKISFQPVFRSYLLDDQRLQWSGQELTFGVEAELNADLQKKFKWGHVRVFSQFFVNQPFDKNILTDETREKYFQNFQVDTFQVKQLFIQVKTGKFTIGLGKHNSIFGRNYTLHLSNSFFDYPFIRTEAVLNYETGLFLGYHSGILYIDLAVVNGSENMDTNSSKGGMARIGLGGKNWAIGVSAKAMDGIGSEWQKQYKNHAGIDLMFKGGKFRFSSELIYDEYGFHRAFPIDDVFWGRSYYYRDLNYKHKTPITGYGGYVDLQYENGKFFFEVNYGEYHPKEIGHPYHDDPIKRAIIKMKLQFGPNFSAFGMGLLENERTKEPLFAGASDYGFLVGLQYKL